MRGQGATVWDNAGREWLDWGMGLRSVILGHAYPAVVEAVKQELDNGSNFTRPSLIESELAETFLNLFPNSNELMVKFAKDGSDTTSAAIRLARAWTGKEVILAAKHNPFYSFNDWWIGITDMNAGAPRPKNVFVFGYDDLPDVEKHCSESHEVAAIIVEPAATAPDNISHGEYLRKMQNMAHEHGALLIFDEMLTGFRWALPGAQTYYDVRPDLSCFGKAMGNGFSVSALVGRRDIMELGGITQTERPRVFLMSATHGGETHSMAAALATIREMQEQPVLKHAWHIGEMLKSQLARCIALYELDDHIHISGHPCSPTLAFDSPELRTLFLQEMCKQGILIPYIAPSYSHSLADVDRTVGAADTAFDICKQALEHGFADYLEGPVVKPVFRRYV